MAASVVLGSVKNGWGYWVWINIAGSSPAVIGGWAGVFFLDPDGYMRAEGCGYMYVLYSGVHTCTCEQLSRGL